MFELHNKFYDNIDDILEPVEFIKSKNHYISNIPASFDIEASSFYIGEQKCGCMYAWVLGINGKCIRGRTWRDFKLAIKSIVKYYNLGQDRVFVIYVHNLSYEFQWFRKRFEWETVFSLDQREPVYARTTDGIEFRCSYKLSNNSLRTIGENLLKYPVQKLVGDLDYEKIRHSETELTDAEWKYILNDGLIVMAYIQELIERYGSLAELPITQTGFVRKTCRDACLKGKERYEYSQLMKNLIMRKEDYEQLKKAFAGGFTHANHTMVYKTHYNVSSFDFTSSYPSVMISEKFPMSKATDVKVTSKAEFHDYLKRYCCLFDVMFIGLRAKFDYDHYISKSKCEMIEEYVLDNGRVVQAEKIMLTITDVDYTIIEKTYEWDEIRVRNFKIFERGYLPKPLIMMVLKFYCDKTTLKGVEGSEENYMRSKEMLNSMYGMSVTDPCRDEIIYNDEDNTWSVTEVNEEDSLEKYNQNRTRFLYYDWGIWVTAYARRNLWTGILEFKGDYIYSDTDSLKVINADKHKNYIEKYNELITMKIKKCLNFYSIPITKACPKTKNGEPKPMGVWDYEGNYDRFKTLGAKRYIYIQNDKLHITIAGVSKTKGADYLMNKFKTYDKVFSNFKENLVFPAKYSYIKDHKKYTDTATGKLTHTYIDIELGCYITDYRGKPGQFHELSCVHLEPTSYDLSMEETFLRYVLGTGTEFTK